MATILDHSHAPLAPVTVANGSWPRAAFETGRVVFSITFALASTDSHWSGDRAIFVASDSGGMYMSTRSFSLYNNTGGGTLVFGRAITWSAGQTVTFDVDSGLGRYTVSGATTGNVTDQSFTPSGTRFTNGNGLLIGRGASGNDQWDINATISDVTDGVNASSATGSAAGTSTATADARTLEPRTGTAAGSATATGIVPGTSIGTAAGTSTATGAAQAIEQRSGSAEGTSTATGVLPSTLSVDDHGEVVQLYGAGSTPAQITLNVDNGSTIVVMMGGNLNDVEDGPTAPGVVFTQVAPAINAEYPNFPGYGTSVYVGRATSTGSLTISQNVTAFDEISMAAVELKGGPRVRDVRWTVQANSGAGSTQTSGAVGVNGPSILVASWWGSAPVGSDHTTSPNNGFTVIEDHLVDNPNGYVQYAMAVREVSSPGSYDVTWTHSPTQGAQLWLVSLTLTQDTGSAAGAATTSGVAAGVVQATGSAAGVATASAVGRAIAAATASAAGAATTTADARAIAAAVASAVGSSTADGEGKAIASATGSAAGSSSTFGASDNTVRATGSSEGSSTATAEARAITSVIGSAAGSSSAAAIAFATERRTASSAGSASTFAVALGASGLRAASVQNPTITRGQRPSGIIVRDHRPIATITKD